MNIIRIRNTIVTLLVAAVLVGGWLVLRSRNLFATPAPVEGAGQAPTRDAYTPDDIVLDGVTYCYNTDLTTILLMGIDNEGPVRESRVYYNDGQADFLMLLILNNSDRTYTMFHVNRDTMCSIEILGINGSTAGYVTQQLALSHAYGNGLAPSCTNTVRALSRLLNGVPIDDYVAMNIDGVARAADLVGGVTVTVKDHFYNNVKFKMGHTYTLTGQDAVDYVRSRMSVGDGSNLSRMERQREFIDDFLTRLQEKLEGENDLLLDAAESMSDYLVMSLTASEISDYSERFQTYTFTGIESIQGEVIQGEQFAEFYPDPDALLRQIVNLFYRRK